MKAMIMRGARTHDTLHFAAALIPALVLIIAAFLINGARQDAQRSERVANDAKLAAATIDRQLGTLLEMAEFCATATYVVETLDLQHVAQDCGRFAAKRGAWVVLIETGETHRQILNTRPDAPPVLPSYPREQEHDTLLALEERSRQSGAPEIAEVFTGHVYPRGIVSSGQSLRLADGRQAMLYVSMPAQSLSEELARLSTDAAHVFGLIDRSDRIVARSDKSEITFLAEIPSWLRPLRRAGAPGARLAIDAPPEIGGQWDFGYHPLQAAPGWIATAAVPADLGMRSWALVSLPSSLAFFGLLLSLLLIWMFGEQNRVARQIASTERARAEAERENQEKSRLLASFAHDIRSPLISLIGSLDLVGQTRFGENVQIGSARSSAELLLQLVDDILEFSFVGSGALALHPSPVDLRQLAEDLVNQLRLTAQNKGLAIRIALDKSLPGLVYLDRLRLQQVLSNLLTNAVKYTERGTITLAIHSGEPAAGSVELAFSVQDTGAGIDPSDIPRIMREFGRLDRPVEKREQGTGLGLPIVQRILKRMGTELTVESAVGQGSTFRFRLVVPTVPDTEKDQGALPLDGIVILYAEDEPVIREVTARRLSAAGAIVVEAENGQDALDRLEKLQPDFLLLDLQMPVLDGAGVIRRLCEGSRKPPYPIFVLTSHIAAPQAAEAREAGADAVFTKPVQIQPLAAAFRARRGDAGQHTPSIGASRVTQDQPVLNLGHFEMAMPPTDKTLAMTLLAEFEASMRRDCDRFHDAIADGDLIAAGKLAHRCLGLCQVLGAERLAGQLIIAESAAAAKDIGVLERLEQELPATLGITVKEMRRVVADRADGDATKAEAKA